MTQHRIGSIEQSMQRRRLAWRRDDSETPVARGLFDPQSIVEVQTHRVDHRLQSCATPDSASHRCSPALTGTAACPLCSHAMTTPSHAPHLCFPCGHSLCLECVTALVPDGPVCQCCDAHIVSTAPNVALRQLLTSSAITEVLTDDESVFALDDKVPQSFTSEHARCSHQMPCRGHAAGRCTSASWQLDCTGLQDAT